MTAATATRLLLVDDHALVRDGLRALLGGHPGIEIVGEAGDADEALERIAATRPDMVLMDIGMKRVDGLTLTARLAAEHPQLAVLILSMYDNAEYVRRARAAGARGYVLKDGPSSDILAAIAAVAAGGLHFRADAAPAETPNRRAELSERERDILRALAEGQSSKQIALAFDLSVRTVETHRQNIRRKLRIAGQAELIRYAVEHFRTPGP